MVDTTMGQRIADQRKKLGLSQEGLGEKLGVSRQAISKWEADGAVPEIDKLIALSKLFSVSVGWLLGVEEENSREDFTEAQLRLVEQIVQQNPQRTETASRWQKWAAVCAVMGVLLSLFALVREDQVGPDYGTQLGGLSASYAQIRSQLEEVTDRLDILSEGELLLANYSAEISPLPGDADAVLSFHAIPEKWQTGDVGELKIFLAREAIAQAMCQWNGTGYTVDVKVPIVDGYTAYFVVTHADGTQEQKLIEDRRISSLESQTKIRIVMEVEGQLLFGRNTVMQTDTVSISNYDFRLTMPEGVPDAQWETVDLVLYQDGEELGRYNKIGLTDSYEIYSHIYRTAFEGINPYIPEGAKIELFIEAKLTNGQTAKKQIGTWILENEALVSVEETGK